MDKIFYISKSGTSPDGPFTLEEIHSAVKTGVYSLNSYYWCRGMDDWKPLSAMLGRPPTPLVRQNKEQGGDCNYDTPFSAIVYAAKHISFKGRASRKEFWMFILGMYLVHLCTILFYIACFRLTKAEGFLIFGAFLLLVELVFHAIVRIPLEARRLHDTGRSGWRQLLHFVQYAFANWWVFLIGAYPMDGIPGVFAFLCLTALFVKWESQESDPYPNEYGLPAESKSK